ncbi:hypothetical protein ACFOGJ_16030 [Marinibaculum pumilum]|uniref:Uncharacterized protein n=1 Tax=Marinibaculum pumilum TaxID=1766165 RepID=A0ABV7L2C3_9PROT
MKTESERKAAQQDRQRRVEQARRTAMVDALADPKMREGAEWAITALTVAGWRPPADTTKGADHD